MVLNNGRGLDFYTYGSAGDGSPYGSSHLASLVVLFRGGLTAEHPITEQTAEQPAIINGTGSLFASVWVKSSRLLRTVEYCGGSLDVTVGADYLSVWISLPAHHLPTIQKDLEAFLLNPVFDTAVFDTEKSLAILDIQGAEDSPQYRAGRLFRGYTYAGTPYALPTIGTRNSVSAITPSHVRAYYDTQIRGDDAVAVLVGSSTEAFRTALQGVLGSIPVSPSGVAGDYDYDYDYLVKESYNEDTDKHTQQAKLFMAWDAPAASDVKGFFATKMLDGVLSTGMSSPYFKRLRDERGYAYAVSSRYAARRNPSRFIATIALDYANAQQCVQDIIAINATVASGEVITPERLEVVYNTIASAIMATKESVAAMAFQYALFAMMGAGSRTFDTYLDELKNVSVDDLRKHSEKVFASPKTVFILKPEA